LSCRRSFVPSSLRLRLATVRSNPAVTSPAARDSPVKSRRRFVSR